MKEKRSPFNFQLCPRGQNRSASGFTATAAADINFAISDWATTSATFVTRTTETHYIEFMPSTENNSYVGMIRGRQVINLAVNGSGNINWASAIHEIGHALGMYHEQSRVDRDNFITINTANIRPGVMHNFQTYVQQNSPGTEFGTFDFASIMLYPSFTTDVNFVFNTAQPMMTRLDGTTWGPNFFVSAGDVETAQLMYGPPFARMRYIITDNWYPDQVDRTADIFIDFFADAACTTPTTLAVSRTVKLEKTIEQYYSGGWHSSSYQYNVALPTGVTSFQLDDDLPLEQISYDYGNIYSGYREMNVYFAGWIRQVTN